MRRVLFVLAVLALALAAWAAAWASFGDRRAPVKAAKVPGIVILCIDTLRADAVDASDATAGLTSLRAWSERATRFTDAIASSSWTAPSVASLLTGLECWDHGIVEPEGMTRIAPSIATIATTLQDAGWSTWASTSGGWVSESGGCAAGFDRFSSDFDERPPSAALRRWADERPADRPFFVLLHTYATHDPYGDHQAARDRRCQGAFDDPSLRSLASSLRTTSSRHELEKLVPDFLLAYLGDPCQRSALTYALGEPSAARLFWLHSRPWIDGGWRADPAGPAVVDRLRTKYYEGMSYADARVAETLDALDELPPDTVVVVVGDHGEAFGEHGALYHGRYVFHEMLHVPLVVRATGKLPEGVAVSGTCSLVDVLPTVLDLAGVDVPAGRAGRSLVTAARDPSAAGRPVVSLVAPPRDPDPVVGGKRRLAVHDDRLAWLGTYELRSRSWTEVAWFDRANDPHEMNPLAEPPVGLRTAELDAAIAAARDGVEARFRAGAPPFVLREAGH